jgi:asparagine synthase (glutamine-hydrolysing)
MCGIAGIIHPEIDPIAYTNNVRAMVRALEHRGPDEQHVSVSSKACLGHARLSIIDLSGGRQPMNSSVTKNLIVFNGEIYGYRELRKSYATYPFNTQSDTELLLAMYEDKGAHLPEHLPGMFSFAIWDESGDQLFAARDRFGEKPFYYAFGKNGAFIFASEIKAILASGLIEPVLDPESLAHYMQRLYVHPQKTIYRNIFTLPPAHALRLVNGNLSIWKYWDFPETSTHLSFEDAKHEFYRLMERSVEKQLQADVPVAAFLSGGLDSSTVVALASKLKPDLLTFSFGFDGSISELPYAQKIANKYRTNHVVLEETNIDLPNLLLEMQNVYDEPFADSSNIPTYLISKLASQHVKVVLTGDGCDELMAGYDFWYRRLFHYKKASKQPDILRYYQMLMRSISYRLGIKQHDVFHRNVTGFSDKKMFSDLLALHDSQKDYMFAGQLKSLFAPMKWEIQQKKYGSKSTLEDALREDLMNYMPGDILVKTDRASMSNSLELRAPFLDKEVAEFCLMLPEQFKIDQHTEKKLMRASFGHLWTKEIRERKKQGFAAPVTGWLKRKEMIELKNTYLMQPNLKILDLASKAELERIAGQDDNTTWALLTLSIWLEKHVYSL